MLHNFRRKIGQQIVLVPTKGNKLSLCNGRQQQQGRYVTTERPPSNTKSSSLPKNSNNNNSSSSSSSSSSSDNPSNSTIRIQKDSSSLKDIPQAFMIGTVAGTMGSLAGMGGGFVMIPLLTSICRLSQHQAHGTSLAAVMATGMAGAISYQDQVDYTSAIPIATTAMITASLGARTTTFLSEKWLKRTLGILLLIMGPAVPAKQYVVEQLSKQQQQHDDDDDDEETKSSSSTSSHTPSQSSRTYPKWIVPASIGLCSGYLAGLFGVGGGTLVVPALIWTSQQQQQEKDIPPYTHHQALATSLAAMVLPAMVGTITHAKAGNVAFRIAPPLALGALVGAYGGGKLALDMEESTLQWGFSGLLILLGVRTIQKTF